MHYRPLYTQMQKQTRFELASMPKAAYQTLKRKKSRLKSLRFPLIKLRTSSQATEGLQSRRRAATEFQSHVDKIDYLETSPTHILLTATEQCKKYVTVFQKLKKNLKNIILEQNDSAAANQQPISNFSNRSLRFSTLKTEKLLPDSFNCKAVVSQRRSSPPQTKKLTLCSPRKQRGEKRYGQLTLKELLESDIEVSPELARKMMR